MTWSYSFEPRGGYDSMTAAYEIRNDDGEIMAVIDCAMFDQSGGQHERNPEAKGIAELIVNAVNQAFRQEPA